MTPPHVLPDSVQHFGALHKLGSTALPRCFFLVALVAGFEEILSSAVIPDCSVVFLPDLFVTTCFPLAGEKDYIC
jgi:hypothetical protein